MQLQCMVQPSRAAPHGLVLTATSRAGRGCSTAHVPRARACSDDGHDTDDTETEDEEAVGARSSRLLLHPRTQSMSAAVGLFGACCFEKNNVCVCSVDVDISEYPPGIPLETAPSAWTNSDILYAWARAWAWAWGRGRGRGRGRDNITTT